MKSDRKALEEAIELLDNPDHWTQGAYAVDRDDHPVGSSSAHPQRWCAVGALIRTCENDEQVQRIASTLDTVTERTCITAFNDNHSYGDVILALKRGLDLVNE